MQPVQVQMQVPPDVLVYIGLGANLGKPHLTLRRALDELSATPNIWALRASHVYRSAPIDAEGPDYLNAVAELRTSLDAMALLRRLQAIENAHGRLRPYRNAPRTLDLDLLWYGGQTLALPDLQIPHARACVRAAALDGISAGFASSPDRRKDLAGGVWGSEDSPC